MTRKAKPSPAKIGIWFKIVFLNQIATNVQVSVENGPRIGVK